MRSMYINTKGLLMKNTLNKKNVSILLGLILILFFVQSVHGQNTIGYQNIKEGDILINKVPGCAGCPAPFSDTGQQIKFNLPGGKQPIIQNFGPTTHAGIVIKDDNGNWAVRESLPKHEYFNPNTQKTEIRDGVVTTPIEEYYARYRDGDGKTYVTVYRVDNEEAAQNAANWAKKTDGTFPTEYWQFIKPNYDDNIFYCSEFVRKAYKSGAGIEIQGYHRFWTSPESLTKSDKVHRVYDGDETEQFAYRRSLLDILLFITPAYGSTGEESNPSSQNDDLGGVDFTQSTINYISLSDADNSSVFSVGFKIQKSNLANQKIDIEKTNDGNLNAFFTGLTLSNSKFWVNLNPWESDRIIDSDLKKTDVGKVMLLADLQMKKDFSKYENPCNSTIGKEYWSRLETKSGQLLSTLQKKYPDYSIDSTHVSFSPVTRHWIIPDTVNLYQSVNEIFVVNATLTIKSDPVSDHSSYQTDNLDSIFVSQSLKSDLNEAAKEYGRYAMETEDQLIRPLVIQDINNRSGYAELRQIFISIALAQAYKKEFKAQSIFSSIIESNDLSDLESELPWNPRDIWQDYKKSFESYDYTCTQSEKYVEGNIMITHSKTYIGGGVDFADIKITDNGLIPDDVRDLIIEAQSFSYSSDKQYYYFTDSLVIPDSSITEINKNYVTSSNSESGFIDSIIQSLLGNLLEHRIYPGQYGSS